MIGSYLGSAVPSRDIPVFAQWWREGRFPVEALVSSRIGLDDVNRAMDELAAGACGAAAHRALTRLTRSARLGLVPALIRWWTQDVTALSPRADPHEVATTGTDLLERWSEPQRRYHSTRHLVEMFWALEDLTDAGELTDADASLGGSAAWLHDAVYDPTAVVGANESASAELAESLLPRVRFDRRGGRDGGRAGPDDGGPRGSPRLRPAPCLPRRRPLDPRRGGAAVRRVLPPGP